MLPVCATTKMGEVKQKRLEKRCNQFSTSVISELMDGTVLNVLLQTMDTFYGLSKQIKLKTNNTNAIWGTQRQSSHIVRRFDESILNHSILKMSQKVK